MDTEKKNNRIAFDKINGIAKTGKPYITDGNIDYAPPSLSDETIRELKGYFAKGLTRESACALVGISSRTLYRYCKHNPDFSQTINDLQSTVIGKAELNIADSIEEGNLDQSRWLLERKARHIYGNKADIAVSTTVSVGSIEETRDALKKSVAAFLGVEDSTQDSATPAEPD